MKKAPFTFLIICLLCNVYSIVGQNIVNGNMEDWSVLGDSNKEHPVGWTTRNHLEENPQANYSLQVNDPYKGDKAILLQNFQPSPTTSFASFLSLGDFNPANPFQRGIAFIHRPVSLNFAYKYFTTKANPSGFFQAKAVIRLTRWDESTNTSVLIAEGEYNIIHKTNVYQLVELPLTYFENSEPDSLYLSFNNPSNPEDQVRLTLDDIHLGYSTVSSDEAYVLDKVRLFPNPAKSTLNIINPQMVNDSQLFIFDSLGRLQLLRDLSQDQEQVDIANLDTGCYFYQIRTEDALVKTGKFFKLVK